MEREILKLDREVSERYKKREQKNKKRRKHQRKSGRLRHTIYAEEKELEKKRSLHGGGDT